MSYGTQYLKDGDEVGDVCPECSGPLLCRRTYRSLRVYCACGKVDLPYKKWGEWAKHRETLWGSTWKNPEPPWQRSGKQILVEE